MGKLEVKGTAERTVDYDLMKLKIDFHAKEETPDKASKKVMRECEDFLARLKERGFDLSAIALKSDDVQQSYNYHNNTQVECYNASRELELVCMFNMKLINEIRSIRSNISISTDVIVGFPGETEELFEKTIDTCRKVEFSKLHVFPYSERKGTASSRMNDKLDGGIIKDRARVLIKVSEELEINYMNKFIGEEVEVLVEETIDGYSYGHTGNFLYCKIKGEYNHNEFINVKVSEIIYPYCICK